MKQMLLFLAFLFFAGHGRADVVVSFSVLADIVSQVTPKKVTVRTLVPVGKDAHGFDLTAAEMKTLAKASMVIRVGAGFEPWLDSAIKASATKATVVTMAEGVKLRKVAGGHHHAHDHSHAHGDVDPHLWLDPRLVLVFSDRLAETLIARYPDQADEIRRRSADWRRKLQTAHLRWSRELSEVKGALLVPHEAFGYMADAYGLQFRALVGLSSDAQPTIRQVAHWVKEVRANRVTALYHEGDFESVLIRQVARETGREISGHLYSDSLSTKSGGPTTYLALMEHNVSVIASRPPQ